MEHRTEKIFYDLANQCAPADQISPVRELYKWNSVPYETADFSGTMIASLGSGRPQELTLDPKLTGWYRVFVGQFSNWIPSMSTDACLKLTSWPTYTHFSYPFRPAQQNQEVCESFWCCADMTDQSVQIAKEANGRDTNVTLAWFRFVPMSEEEVEQFKAEQLRRDTKRIYATNDMHGMICGHGYRGADKWLEVVDEYRQSDVAWLSMEDLRYYDGELSTGDPENFTFSRVVDKRVQTTLQKEFTREMLGKVIDYGHKQGLKMCFAYRMGGWGMEFPLDQMYFDNRYTLEHRHLRCVDRDGTNIDALSYAFPEVQDHVIDMLLDTARLGADAVELMAHRGMPYVLFEQPVVERFMEQYGEDPRYLPLDDSRLNKLHCQIITEFFRKLRQRLNEETGENKVRIHLRAFYSVYDSRAVGLDVEQLAAEGLVDAIITYPLRMYERLDAEVWQQDGVHIDLEKYPDYVRRRKQPIIARESDFAAIAAPVINSRGEPCGPADLQQCVEQWMQLEKKYGCEMYFEIMPRHMAPEQFRERALELYNCGAERISLWDTYNRAPRRVEWSMIRRLGHKQELAGYTSGEGEYYRYVRVLKVGWLDVSRYFPAWGG